MKIKITLLIMLCYFSVNSNSKNLDDIFRIAKESGCVLNIKKYPDSYFLLTPEHQLFWCKRNDENGFFDLVVNTKITKEWSSCSPHIPVQSSTQNPIWISNNPQPYGKPINLNEFWYISEELRLSESKMVKENLIITNGSFSYGIFDDVGQILYCHNGKWVMYGFH